MVIFVRSSCPKVFCRKGVLRNFANAIGNICARVLFLIKLHDGKNKLWHWCFPVNFVIKHNSYVHNYKPSHSATRRRSDVEATSLCTSKQRHRYVSNETPNDGAFFLLYLWYTSLHACVFSSVSHKMGKDSQPHLMRRTWEIG